MIKSEDGKLKFEFKINTAKMIWNLESFHLELLLAFKHAKNTFYALNSVCVDIDEYSQLEELFKAIPEETLLKCGYDKKNKTNFERLLGNLEVLRNEKTHDLAVSTNFVDIPHTKGLEFLKVKKEG